MEARRKRRIFAREENGAKRQKSLQIISSVPTAQQRSSASLPKTTVFSPPATDEVNRWLMVTALRYSRCVSVCLLNREKTKRAMLLK